MRRKLKAFVVCSLITSCMLCFTSCTTEEQVVPVPKPSAEKNSDKAGSSAVMFQAFTLFHMKWTDIQAGAPAWGSAGFNWVWFPPASRAADTYGYLPTQWYDFNNWRG